MRYLVLDLETSGKDTFGRFNNPLDPSNEITAIAWATNVKSGVKYCQSGIDRNVPINLENVDILIGQNFKFDLLYLWKNEDLQDFLARGGEVWDTMLAEYLLSGQQRGQNDLNSLALRYGGKLKDEYIGEQFKLGKMSKEIDEDKLKEYAEWDVKNTRLVFEKQYKLAKKEGILKIIRLHQRHLLAVCEMEANGMHVDLQIANCKLDQLTIQKEKIKGQLQKLQNQIDSMWPKNLKFEFTSATDLSTLFFGGDRKIKERVSVGHYKNGKEKFKLVDSTVNIVGFSLPTKPEWATKILGKYSVDDDVLTYLEITHKKSIPLVSLIANAVSALRGVDKLISTYYYSETKTAKNKIKTTGIISKLMPGNFLHSEFRMCSTETGRLSSTKPNIQNMPPSILDMFTSRWGQDGCIVEADFSQLEVIVQAFLTQSEKMIDDIRNGVDFHRLRLSYAHGTTYEDVINLPNYAQQRKEIAKPISFQKAYGAMPETVSQRTGIPLETVQKVFSQEDAEYPEIKQYYADILEGLNDRRGLTSETLTAKNKRTGQMVTLENERKGIAQFVSVTGKKYTFSEKAVITKRGDVFRYWQIPEIQNYPVQGLASDIVAIQVGELYNVLRGRRDSCKIINEVHDSLILDVKKDSLEEITTIIKTIMPDLKTTFKKYFGMDFNVPLDIDIKHGNSWAHAKQQD